MTAAKIEFCGFIYSWSPSINFSSMACLLCIGWN